MKPWPDATVAAGAPLTVPQNRHARQLRTSIERAQRFGPGCLSDFAAKRLQIIAQGFSPGLGERMSRPESTPNPADPGCNSELAQYSNTPSLRVAGFEDDDDDEDENENEAPQEWRPNGRSGLGGSIRSVV